MPQVVMYCKSWCPYCHRARALLVSKGVPVEEIDIEQWPERQRGDAPSQRPYDGTADFIGERHVGGCDDIYGLDAAGGLDPLLRGS